MSVCVNADRTGQLAPPLFFTNEPHLENNYVYVRKTSRGKVAFLLFILGGGGVSVCVNADRTGQLAPPLFLQMSHIWKITMYMWEKRQEEKWLFLFVFFWVSVCVNGDRTGQLTLPLF